MPAVRDLILNLQERRQGNALVATARDLDKLAHGADASGDAFERMAADAKKLEVEIAATKARIVDLNSQFAHTGDRSLFGDIRHAERDLKVLERMLGSLGDVGTVVTNSFSEQLAGAFSSTSKTPIAPIVIGALVEAAALAAPSVGAMLAGGIAGAAGTGAMAAGILSAVKDERVRSAAKSFGDSISAEFFSGGDAFVQPILDSLDTLERGFADMHLPEALEKAAPTVEVIAEGLAAAGKNFMPGFNKFLDNIGPLADAASRGIADTGEALGDFLDSVSSSKGTVEGLELLFTLVNGTVRVLGNSLEWLGNTTHRFNRVAGELTGGLEDVFGAVGLEGPAKLAGHLNDQLERMTGTGESLHGMFRKLGTEGVDPFASYLHEAQQRMEQLRGETEATRKSLVDYFNTLQGQLDANLAWEQAIDDLTESVLENGRTLDITTEKGRNNIRAVEEGLEAARRQYEQGQLTSAQYDEQIRKLVDIGVKAGLSRQELEKLAKPYEIRLVVDLINTQAVAAKLGAIADQVRRAFGFVWSGGGSGGGTTNRRESFAVGGETPAFMPFEVHSGEILWSNKRQFVSTASQSRDLLSGASGGGSPPVTISFAATGDPFLDALVRELKKYIRVNGGTSSDSVQAALGY